jgi:hypothetical protein
MTHEEVYLLPDKIEPDLERVRGYWNGLKRGENAVPFADDVKFSARARLARDVFLIEVFENRFRLELVGEDVVERYGAPVNGVFLDEIALHPPFDELIAQCRATTERRAPTYYTTVAGDSPGYSRLVLPLWGNGGIEMLLAAMRPLSPSGSRRAQ